MNPAPLPPPPPDTRCPLCGAPAGGLAVERCPSCNMTLAGLDGRPGPYSAAARWGMAAAMLACYAIVVLVVLLAR